MKFVISAGLLKTMLNIIETNNFFIEVTKYVVDSIKFLQLFHVIEANTSVIKTTVCRSFDNIAIESTKLIPITSMSLNQDFFFQCTNA